MMDDWEGKYKSSKYIFINVWASWKSFPGNLFHGCAAYVFLNILMLRFAKVPRASIPVKLLKIPAFPAQKGTALLGVPGTRWVIAVWQRGGVNSRGRVIVYSAFRLLFVLPFFLEIFSTAFLFTCTLNVLVCFPCIFLWVCMYECILKQKWDHPCFKLFPKKGPWGWG